MKARCANCQTIFDVVASGRQTCPNCGTVLELELPQSASPAPQTSSDSDNSSGGDMRWAPPDLRPMAIQDMPVIPLDLKDEPPKADSGANPAPQTSTAWGSDAGGSGPTPNAFSSNRSAIVPTPWERRSELGFFKGFFDTIIQSVTHPIEFFSRMPRDNAKGAFSFYWIIVSIAALVGFFVNVSGMDQDNAEKVAALREKWAFEESGTLKRISEFFLDFADRSFTPGMFLGFALFCAISVAIYFFIHTGVMHVSAKLLGGHGNFDATMRAIGYSAAPQLMNLVPFVGKILSGIGNVVFVVIGISELHQVSRGKAVAIYFLPFLVSCCGGCGLSIALGGMGSKLF